jgi:hypothetical protein
LKGAFGKADHSNAFGNIGLPESSEFESGVSISADWLAWLEAKILHQARVIRIHPFGAKTHSDIVTQPLGIEHFQFAIACQVARPAMNGAAVKDRAVSRLHIPTDDIVVIPVPINIGKRLVAFANRISATITKVHLPKLLGPTVRAAYKLQGALFLDRYQRHPDRAGIKTLDRPVRFVLMKRGSKLRARGANKDGIKEEINLIGA